MNKKPNDASSPNGKEKFEVADVFRLYGEDYRLNTKSAGLLPSEVMLNNAINAGLNESLITHAETGIAQNVKPWSRKNGLMIVKLSCFPVVIFI